MEIITVGNQKGGCAKTSTVWALGTGLNKLKGLRVLMIDLDAQRNLSYTAGLNLLETQHTMYHVFKGDTKLKACIQTVGINLDIVCGGLELSQADMEFTKTGREYMLREALEVVQDDYDFCICDTEPHLGVMTTNALTASDSVIIPIQADIYGLQGLEQLRGFIDTVKKYSNPNLEISGILITRLDSRTTLAQTMTEQIQEQANEYGYKVFDTRIRQAVAVGESALLQEDIYASNSTVAQDYSNFIDEFMKGDK